MKKRSTNPRMAMMMGRAMRRPALEATPEVAQPAVNPMAAMAGGMPGMKKGGETMKSDTAQDKAMIKKAMKQHDAQEHQGGKGTKLSLKKGGMSKGCGYADGGRMSSKGEHSVQKQSKRGAIAVKMASGGKVSQLAKANSIAVRGKTKGKIC